MQTVDESKVLLVNSNSDTYSEINHILNKNGYSCGIATSVDEFLFLLKTNSYNLFLIDIVFLLNSTQLLDSIRAIVQFKYTPVLVLSSLENESRVVELLNSGVDDFIHLPIRQSWLLSKIKVNINKFNLKQDILVKSINRTLSKERGVVLICSNENSTRNNQIFFAEDSITVCSANALFYEIENKNVWYIFVEACATWIFSILEKLNTIANADFPIVFLGNSDSIDSVFAQNFDFIFDVNNNINIKDLMSFLLHRELTLKSKYITAINQAANSSTMNFARIVDRKIGNFSLSVLYEPYNGFPGGDFYEIYEIDDCQKIIFFGDVMGKSWDAWFYVPAYLAYIRSTMKLLELQNEKSYSPHSILNALNIFISNDIRFANVFSTLSVINIDVKTNKMTFASAGAILPLYYNKKENSCQSLMVLGVLIGLDATNEYFSHEIDLQLGDKLLFYTDGYAEAEYGNQGKRVGIKGVTDVFIKNKDKIISALELEDELLATFPINQFDDDRTLMLISLP